MSQNLWSAAVVIGALRVNPCGRLLYRGSYMSAHVLLNLLNELGKSDKMRGLQRS